MSKPTVKRALVMPSTEENRRIVAGAMNDPDARPLTPAQLKELYQQSRALVYPSTFESFGLPLIEARQAGIAILAGELDYVRDLVDPEETFDPGSPVSIARAIKRFLRVSEASLNVLDAKTYLAKVMAGE